MGDIPSLVGGLNLSTPTLILWSVVVQLRKNLRITDAWKSSVIRLLFLIKHEGDTYLPWLYRCGTWFEHLAHGSPCFFIISKTGLYSFYFMHEPRAYHTMVWYYLYYDSYSNSSKHGNGFGRGVHGPSSAWQFQRSG